MDKRTVPVTIKLSEEELERLKQAGEVLYGKNHPVPRGTLIRELLNQRAEQILKRKPRHRRSR
jgi:hypothetical protein